MTTTPRIGLRRLGVVTAIVLASAALFVAPASAHTKLIKSTPARGSSVKTLTEVTLVFSENINASVAKVQIRGAGGAQGGASTPPRVKGATVTQPAAPDLKPGDYTIAYRVVSADGHPVTGEVPFTLTGPSGGSEGEQVAPAPADPVAPAVDGGEAAAPTPAPEKSSGTANWLMAGGGLLIGILIGVGVVFVRKRKSAPASSGE
ncbi:copper resistance protein CopC [Actinomadura sp. HBU206391]|uniref:copper resistance CopC family protein n=1 Tax=Actinomadura sp. HBU206391 TaxID=2731692 RepID=UPI00164EF2A8|nr:copper resistance CopC family protein [Actinomadura sp. HBU206391]MBC6461859.1 copper resistance protein CopC [Actinomadura sp. HBU206391]